MIAVIDTNHLLRLAAAYQRSPLFAAHADYIVTTDGDLLDDADLSRRLQTEWHLRVVEPAEFLAAVS